MSRDEIIKQAEHVVTTSLEAEYGGNHDPAARSVTQALADAGLLARTLPTRDELEDTILNTLREPFNSYADAADGVMALLKGQDA